MRALLPAFLAGQRWYDPVAQPDIELRRVDTLVDDWPTLLWLLVEVRGAEGPGVHYQLPLGATPDRPAHLPESALVGRLDTPRGAAHLFDAMADERTALAFAHHVAPDLHLNTVRPQGGGRSHTSLVLDERYLLKVFRHVRPGPNPDVEVTEALGRVGYGAVPVPVAAWRRNGTDLAVLRRFERSRGDGLELATSSLREMLNLRRPPRDCKLDFATEARLLGENVARLHVALGEAFGVAPADGRLWGADLAAQLQRVADGRLDRRRIEGIYARLDRAEDLGAQIRIHGDLRLGRVLRLQRDWMIIDFEGEAERTVQERRHPSSPLRDVAGMTRSFQAAAQLALRQLEQPDRELAVLADAWVVRNVNTFLAGYADVDEAHRLLPGSRTSRDALLSVFELDEAVHEVADGLARRPGDVELPILAVERLLDGEDELPEGPHG